MRPTLPLRCVPTLVLITAIGLLPRGLGQEPAKEKSADRFTKWEKAIAAFEEQDRKQPPVPGGILFVGSSSIRLWKLDKSFPGVPVLNRGFGGSHIADSTHFAPRIILKHRPKLVLLYAGDNDLAAGGTPEKVLTDFRALVQGIHKELPRTSVGFLSIKPSLARWQKWEQIQQANALVKAYCAQDRRLLYLDVSTGMLGPDGKPRPELFVKDGLHLSPEGYALWTAVVKPVLVAAAAESESNPRKP